MKEVKPEQSDEHRFYRSLNEDPSQLAKSWTDMYLEYMGMGQTFTLVIYVEIVLRYLSGFTRLPSVISAVFGLKFRF